MAALHHLGEQGGWPLTMFLTHDAEPIWGGTYFPKSSRYGRPAFVDVLREVARMFREEPQKIERDLMKVIPRDKWIIFAHQIILHGRALCIARKPKCADCPLEDLCHAADKTWSTVEIHKGAR